MELASGEFDHALKVGLPKTLRCSGVARLELFDPQGDGVRRGHAEIFLIFLSQWGGKERATSGPGPVNPEPTCFIPS